MKIAWKTRLHVTCDSSNNEISNSRVNEDSMQDVTWDASQDISWETSQMVAWGARNSVLTLVMSFVARRNFPCMGWILVEFGSVLG